MTWIRYVIPEDGDDFLHPNVYQLNADQISLNTIVNSFPIPGNFHFRVLRELGNGKISVWMDINDANVPFPQGNIFVKANRLDLEPFQSFSGKESVNQFQASENKSSKATNATNDLLSRKDSESLLDTSSVGNVQPSQSVAPSAFDDSNNDLLGFTSAPSVSVAPKSNNSNTDLFGLDTLKPAQGSDTPLRNPSPMPNNMGGMNNAFQGMSMGNNPRGPMNPMMGAQSMPRGPGMNAYDPFSSIGNVQPNNNQQQQSGYGRGMGTGGMSGRRY